MSNMSNLWVGTNQKPMALTIMGQVTGATDLRAIFNMADKGYAMQGAEKKQGGEQKETSCLEC
jgi:hypothetical protein